MKRLCRSGLYCLTGAALVLALLAGCTQPQKSGAAKAPTAQTAQNAPAPQPAAPAAVRPASKTQPGPASPAQTLNPTEKKAAPVKPSASKAQPRPGPEVASPSADTADPTKKAGCCPSDGKTVDLTPPPADQPQPKLVCKQTKIVADPIWQGKEGTFKFAISNEGQAPLAIRIKPT